MFDKLRQKIQANFAELAKGTLFQVEIDRDKIWEIYLAAFSEENRQPNNCRCCRSFLRQYGGVVGIKDNKMVSIWDITPDDEEFNASIKALSEYVHSLPISGIFLNPEAKCGTEKNLDTKRGVIWQHYYTSLPSKFVSANPGTAQGNAVANKDVLKRSLEELTDDAVNTTLELIGQNSLYRGQEFKGMLTEFQKLKEAYKKTKGKLKDNFCWDQSTKVSAAVSRINNSSIGTLLKDLSEGKDLDKAVGAFERVVAPANYKRPTALVTPKMVEQAKTRLSELNLLGALERRILSDRDLTADNALFVHRASGTALLDVFDEIKKDVTINPKTLSKVEEISIKDFIEKVLPTAKSVKVLVENAHLGNFVTLVGPKNADSGRLFKWNNDFSWSYSGEVADSVKEKVKQAGGKVDGFIRISLAWHNFDDLDLHVFEPNGYHIYYGNKRQLSSSGGTLDVDMNAGYGTTRAPVENIIYVNPPKNEGRYKVVVNQFRRQEAANTGWQVELEYNGEVFDFSGPDNKSTGHNFNVVEFDYSRKDGLTFVGEANSSSKYPSKEKWGIKTGQFHLLKAVTYSPNYWQNNIGNKHVFFFLAGCKSDERARSFYNEFLKEELSPERKVFETLAGKLTVEASENELSGLGFSETLKNHIYAEVEGAFKRTLKVNF